LPGYHVIECDAIGHDNEEHNDYEGEERWSRPDIQWHYGLLCDFVLPEAEDGEEEECDYEEHNFVGC
jgi:hypothetical protein